MNNYQLNIHKNLGDKVEVDLAKKQGGWLILFSHPPFLLPCDCDRVQNSSLTLYLLRSVEFRETISQMKPARNSMTPRITARSAR